MRYFVSRVLYFFACVLFGHIKNIHCREWVCCSNGLCGPQVDSIRSTQLVGCTVPPQFGLVIELSDTAGRQADNFSGVELHFVCMGLWKTDDVCDLLPMG